MNQEVSHHHSEVSQKHTMQATSTSMETSSLSLHNGSSNTSVSVSVGVSDDSGSIHLSMSNMHHVDDDYMRPSTTSTAMTASARIQSKKSMVSLSPACNFEAFSLHFHLPLKAAAEKFGVRATAFKKRCRAIGIRHWPYRKVRSLKRSLQELNRCKEQGTLNEKQQYQYATFKKQLDKLMSPETYGIDPSGRITIPHNFDDDEDSGDDESYDSPRYGATFSECSISPAETDKVQPFADFPSQSQMHSMRKHPHCMPSHHMTKSALNPQFPDIPSVSLRLGSSTKDSLGYMNKYPFGLYDHYLHDGDKMLMKSHIEEYDDDIGDHPSSGCLDNPHHDFIGTEMKYDDVRGLHEGEDEFHDHSSHIDYSSERFFDDVFLQISPDYGCLV